MCRGRTRRAVVLAARTAEGLYVDALADEPTVIDGHNLAGEPRGTFAFEIDGAIRTARPSGRRRIDSPRRVGTLRADHRRTGRRP